MIAWSCIAPHGGELIPELADGNLERMAKTRAAMQELGRRCRAAAPETILVFTPHGICVDGCISISIAETATGSLEGENGSHVTAEFPVDLSLALALAERADAHGIPVALAALTEDNRPIPLFPLDWGALIPLWFMGAHWSPPPRIVAVCPSRSLSREQLIAFGRATVEAAEQTGRRIAVICSADQGHGHDTDGPYGFAAGSAEFDAAYCAALAENALPRLLDWEEAWIEAALTDSFWQTLMLHGAIENGGFHPELLSYEAPTYFGMACAEFRRVPGDATV